MIASQQTGIFFSSDDADQFRNKSSRVVVRWQPWIYLRLVASSAFSGCPKGHRDFTEAKCQRHFGRLQAFGMLTLEPERLKNQRTTTRRRSPEMEGALHRRRSSGLRLQFRNVEIFPLLP